MGGDDKVRKALRLVEDAILEAEDQGRTSEVGQLCGALQKLWAVRWGQQSNRIGTERLGPRVEVRARD